MADDLFDFAVITIFSREFLEGGIIIGEYRTIIVRGDALQRGVRKEEALREVTLSALFATAFALVVIAAIAIPLAILSHNFDDTTSNVIGGLSKIVAGICLLQLSLKIPKFLGIYGSCKKKKSNADGDEGKLTLRSIRFNVAWNIWREVAECGVFLIPFFLSGENLGAIPLSAVVGSVVGSLLAIGIYFANKKLKNKLGLAIFAVLLLCFLSAGLFTGGAHQLEEEINPTKQVWAIEGSFWDVNRLPMTIFKPFGYNDTRTVLEIVCFWSWLLLCSILHYRKYRRAPKMSADDDSKPDVLENRQMSSTQTYEANETVELGGSLGESTSPSSLTGRLTVGGNLVESTGPSQDD